jgi:hypothetical protein
MHILVRWLSLDFNYPSDFQGLRVICFYATVTGDTTYRLGEMEYTEEQRDAIWRYINSRKLADLYKFKAGDTLIVINPTNTPFNRHQNVTALCDTVDGIFESRPFIRVKVSDSETFFMHASRCVPLSAIGHPHTATE